MRCPYCNSLETRVIDTRHDANGNIRRRRECRSCEQRFSTVERAILTCPMVIKRDERREEFDREKILSGLRIACARRPIPAAELENIVDRVEYQLRQSGRTEITSSVIGDLVLEELREIDEVAYIRYAIVFLGLGDLDAVRDEIDRLRTQHYQKSAGEVS
ncbi:MAG: transcriptional regulator NrdR [Anaerolineae bacterium]